MRLLQEDEPAPVEMLRPAGRSAFVLVADHAGRRVPGALGRLGLPESELERHIAWDIGIAGVTRHLSEMLDATAVMQRYSRLVVDCNRPEQAESFIAGISEHTEIPGNRDLPAADRAARIAEIYAPYHAQIAAVLDARHGRPTVLIAMHSFTPVYKGEARGMHAGVLYNRDTRLAREMLGLLRAEPCMVVGDNAPYALSDATDRTIPLHGEGRGLPHVELEIRQDLIAGAAGQLAWAERLARLLPAALARLASHASAVGPRSDPG